MIFLTVEEALLVAERALGHPPEVRDVGLLESALARPRATAFGRPAYGSIHEMAAALLHSVVRNHALVDGNKRLGLAVVIVFYGVNGHRLVLSNDAAYELVMDVAAGRIDALAPVADRLRLGVQEGR